MNAPENRLLGLLAMAFAAIVSRGGWARKLSLPFTPAMGSPSGWGRARFALLAAVMAALSSAACFPEEYPPVEGITRVGVSADGMFVVSGDMRLSEDGGETWTDSPATYRLGEAVISWGGQTVVTPRGTYSIENSDIVVQTSVGAATVYSGFYLRTPDNRRAQAAATRSLEERTITTSPKALVYDGRSGNVVAAMGLQGALVGRADGSWSRVGLGSFTPTDFSATGKLLILLRDVGIQALAVAAALQFTGMALLLSNTALFTERRAMWHTILIIFPMPVLAIPVWVLLVFYPIPAVLASIPLGMALMFWRRPPLPDHPVPIPPLPEDPPDAPRRYHTPDTWRGGATRRILGSGMAAIAITTAVVSVVVFPEYVSGARDGGISLKTIAHANIEVGAALCAVLFSAVLVAMAQPRLDVALRALVGLVGLVALIELSFFLWVQNAVPLWMAKVIAGGSIAAAGPMLMLHLRSYDRRMRAK